MPFYIQPSPKQGTILDLIRETDRQTDRQTVREGVNDMSALNHTTRYSCQISVFLPVRASVPWFLNTQIQTVNKLKNHKSATLISLVIITAVRLSLVFALVSLFFCPFWPSTLPRTFLCFFAHLGFGGKHEAYFLLQTFTCFSGNCSFVC